MDIASTSNTQAYSNQTATTSKQGALTDYQSFLNLFVTQLKYQDPLNPASQEDFLSQTAQFSSVEQLMNLNTKLSDFSTLSRASVASLIGRRVQGNVMNTDGTMAKVDGLVSQVDYGSSGGLVLGLQDGTSLPFSDVETISQN
jgi:flagellar basal-body rod modification protein FlgD